MEEILNDKLREIFQNPKGWGGSDSLEPLILTLLSLRLKVKTGFEDGFRHSYLKFLDQKFGPSSSDLKTLCEGSLVKMVETLSEFERLI